MEIMIGKHMPLIPATATRWGIRHLLVYTKSLQQFEEFE